MNLNTKETQYYCGVACLGFFSIIATCNWFSFGLYNQYFTPLLLLSLLALTVIITRTRGALVMPENAVILIAGIFFIIAGMFPAIIYVHRDELLSIRAYKTLVYILLFCGLITLLLLIFDKNKRTRVFFIVAASVMLAHWLVLRASPLPAIDVFINSSIAADTLLSCANPYSAQYPDLYHGAYGYYPAAFGYWPFYLLSTLIPRILGDIRLLTIFCIGTTVICTYRIALKNGSITNARSVLILFLSLPSSIFITEQGWIDPLLLGLLSILALCLYSGKWFFSSVVLGLIISTKQYGFIMLLPTYIVWYKSIGLKKSLLFSFVSLLTVSAIILPFVIVNPSAFYESTIQIFLRVSARNDSSSIPAFLHHSYQCSMPSLMLPLIYILILLVMGAWQFRSPNTLSAWLATIGLTYAWIFAFGKQAFANYHHFSISILLLSFAFHECKIPSYKAIK